MQFMKYSLSYAHHRRWSKAIHRVDLLVSASQHLFSLPHLTWRPAVASYIYLTHIFPVFELFVALEENPQLLAIASAGGNVCGGAGAGVVIPADAALGGLGGQQLATKLHSKQTQVFGPMFKCLLMICFG